MLDIEGRMKMRDPLAVATLTLCLSLSAGAQEPASNTQNPPAAGDAQKNAASATQDNSAIGGDQETKPAGAKDSTLTGCLSGPDKDGKFEVRSMQYRSGIEVMGPDDLKKDAGKKVKLTGAWQPGTPGPGQSAKMARRFQATDVEVMSEVCKPPSETTPLSKKKQQEQQQKKNSAANPQ
jgi:hypothetical protein